jgi:hypothetical protein
VEEKVKGQKERKKEGVGEGQGLGYLTLITPEHNSGDKNKCK